MPVWPRKWPSFSLPSLPGKLESISSIWSFGKSSACCHSADFNSFANSKIKQMLWLEHFWLWEFSLWENVLVNMQNSLRTFGRRTLRIGLKIHHGEFTAGKYAKRVRYKVTVSSMPKKDKLIVSESYRFEKLPFSLGRKLPFWIFVENKR